MNVFVLNSGRCGSTTFIKACHHICNYTSSHESKRGCLGELLLDYPENHIEADNRLTWFLGRLDLKYGDDATYIHLTRDVEAVARSYSKRLRKGTIIPAYRGNILRSIPDETSNFEVAMDYCQTANENIKMFLRDKTKKMTIDIDNPKASFKEFWGLIGADGELDLALAEFDFKYNSSGKSIPEQETGKSRQIIRNIKGHFSKYWR